MCEAEPIGVAALSGRRPVGIERQRENRWTELRYREMVTPAIISLVGLAAPVISLVAALVAFVVVGRGAKRLSRQAREQAAYAMDRLNEQSEHRSRELRLVAQQSRRDLEREADRRFVEHVRQAGVQQRRDAYGRFLAAANVYLLACYSADRDHERRGAEMVALGQALWAALAPVYLLGPPQVVEAADVYSRLLVLRLGQGRSVSPDELKTVRDVFIHVARLDLEPTTHRAEE